MQKLVAGLHKFQSEVFTSQRKLFERLADGQNPETLFITCSDSRVNPNLLTQTGPGDLFILRNAGNIVPPYSANSGGEVATIEYAVAALGVRDIIVCGHSGCGAMKAVLEPQQASSLPAVGTWLRYADSTRRIIEENYKHLEGEARLTATVEENVLVQLENLRTHPSVAARISKGDLNLHAWVYKIGTGEVFSYDPEQSQYVAVTEASVVPTARAARRATSI
jgi:carbonic anhydrase